jgi:hypothetical protein
VTADQFLEIGSAQFEKRLRRVEQARAQSLDDVLYGEADDADKERPSETRPASLPESERSPE